MKLSNVSDKYEASKPVNLCHHVEDKKKERIKTDKYRLFFFSSKYFFFIWIQPTKQASKQ